MVYSEFYILLEKIYKINRLRLVDGEAVANEVVYIPCEYCGFVTRDDLEGSLFKLLEEKGHKEIAEMLGITEHTSSSQLYRAKTLLMKKINDYRKRI